MQFGIQLRCIGICREPTLSCVSRQDQTGRSKRGKPRKDLDELQKNNVLSVCFCPCSKCGFLFSGCCSKCMVLTCSKCRVWNFGKICSKWLSATIVWHAWQNRRLRSMRPLPLPPCGGSRSSCRKAREQREQRVGGSGGFRPYIAT